MAEKIEVGVTVKGANKATQELDGMDKATKDLGSSFSGLTGALDKMTGGAVTGFKNAVKGVKSFIVGLKLTKAAIISTGIGAIVVAVVALVAAFASTNKGAKAIKIGLAALGAVVERVTAYFQAAGKYLVGLFTKGHKAAAAEYRDEIDKLPGSMLDAINKAIELEQRLQALRTSQRNLSLAFAEGRAQIKEYNLIAEDTTKSLEERLAAGEKAIEIEKKLMAERQRIAEEELAIARQKAAQSDTSEDDLDNLAQLEVNLINIRTESAEMQTTLNNKINTIRAEAARKAKEAADAIIAEEKKKQDEYEETYKKKRDAEKKIVAEADKARSYTMNAQEKELFDLETQYFALEEAQLDYIDHVEENEQMFREGELERAEAHLTAMEETFYDKKAEMEERHAQASVTRANEEAAALIEARQAVVDNFMASIAAIQAGRLNDAKAAAINRRNDLVAQATTDEEIIAIDKKLKAEQNRIAIEGAKKARKLAIVSVLIEQGRAIASAIAGAQAAAAAAGPGAVVASPVFTATMIAIVLGGFAQIKGIMNQAGANMPTMDAPPDLSGGGAGGGGGTTETPETAGAQLALTPDLAASFGETLGFGAVQAYIVQNQIADSDALQSAIEQQAALGDG